MSFNRALIIVDMQKSFSTIITPELIQSINRLIQEAIKMKYAIIFIQSFYNEVPDPDPETTMTDVNRLLNGTHTGKQQMCIRGTCGSEFVDGLIMPTTCVVIEKHYYSAFKNTKLRRFMTINNIGKLYICGVTTNTCVAAVSIDATMNHYCEVFVCGDATNAFNNQDFALEKIRQFAPVLSLPQMIDHMETIAEKSKITHNIVPPELIDLNFDTIKNDIKWLEMLSFGRPVPRLIAIQGDVTADGTVPLYRHPTSQQPQVVPWSPIVYQIKEFIKRTTGENINHCLIQWYRNGNDYIGEHSDKTLDIVAGTHIYNFTVGASRTMIFKRKSDKKTDAVVMQHNSLFGLDLTTNAIWTHEIRQDGRTENIMRPDELRDNRQRISFTFRTIGTFIDPSGKITGQGARTDDNTTENDSAKLLEAFGIENSRSDFTDKQIHDQFYGTGFNAVYVGQESEQTLQKSFIVSKT